MSIRFIDELVPNGKTFPIADVNNIRGGLHYAETVKEMEAIHASRLAPGVQCFVEETDMWYEYDFNEKIWIRSRMGNSLYVCTQDGVASDEKSAEKIGVLNPTSRGELETMTLNEILTRAFFAEKAPFYKETKPTWNHAEIEVGMPLLITQWTPGTKGTYSYGYQDGKLSTGTIIEDTTGTRTLAHTEAKFGNNTNVCTIPVKYEPIINVLGTSLKTSWGRTRDEYNAENTPNVSAPVIPLISQQTYNASGSYVGYYLAQYVASPRTGVMTTLQNDINTIAGAGILAKPTQISTKIKTNTTADILLSGLPNSAFVYVWVPSPLKISVVKMLNGLTAQYDTVAASRYGKVSAVMGNITLGNISFDGIPRKNGTTTLYEWTLWYIGKGDKNAAGEVSPSDAPLKITISK